MSVKVKICGIRTSDAALAAAQAGADFFGFNFVPSSGRYLEQEHARAIIGQLGSHVKIVGVFHNHVLEDVKRIVAYLKLDFVQLHGDESPTYCRGLTQYAGVIKAFCLPQSFCEQNVLDEMSAFDVDYFLLDREKQGEGEVVDWEKAYIISREFPIFLAGGLTPENVADAVTQVKPYAVDVAGGIENDGVHDIEKIQRFIRYACINSSNIVRRLLPLE